MPPLIGIGTATLTLTTLLVVLLDELEATIMLIVTEYKEELTESITVARPHGGEDLDQLLVRKMSGKRTDGLGIDVRPGSGVGGAGRRENCQGWTGIVATKLVGPSLIGLDVTVTELTHDGKSDLGVECDPITEADLLETGRNLDGVRMPEEARIQLPDAI